MATNNRRNRRNATTATATAMEENMETRTAPALPAARPVVARDNLLEAAPAAAPVVTNTASPAVADAHAPIYSASIFNINNPASARLPLLAAHILEAINAGKASTCSIYNFLRDARGWKHLPGSVAFRAATEAAGLLCYTNRKGGAVVQGNRTRTTEGAALRSIARCYAAPATGTEGNA